MRRLVALVILLGSVPPVAAAAQKPRSTATAAAVAEVYFWKAKPGKLDDYNRYIREFAEPIDREAQRAGAFLSITTYLNPKPDAPWTHMRVFLLRDRAQQAALSQALDDAKLRLHPDEAERKRQADYAETLREVTHFFGRDLAEAGHVAPRINVQIER